MRKSSGSVIALSFRAFLFLTVVLSLTVFGLVSWLISAQNSADDGIGTVALGKSSVDDTRLVHAQADNAALAPEGGGIFYEVDSTGDGGLVGSPNFCNDGTNHCTLRAAIQAANLHFGNNVTHSVLISFRTNSDDLD